MADERAQMAGAQQHFGYIRFPTIHDDQIVFAAEDDLWRVPAAGGRAERLTADVADASDPRFAPDGSLIAFTGRTEGPAEVYVMPAAGGEARRLTYHGANTRVVGWRPDGSAILYSSNAEQGMRRWQTIFAIAPTGGEPTMLPFGMAHSIAYGPSGAIVVGRHTAEPARWKRYRGGTAGFLWIDPTGAGEFHRLTDLGGNVTCPCWVGDRVYFISDHEGLGHVYSCLATGEDLRRHTRHDDFYARGLATDGHRLVYHAGGDLFLLDPNATESARVAVQLPGSRSQRARRFAPAARFLDSWRLHPRGHSVALTTRGKAFSLGNWEGGVLQHGAPDGVRYRLLTYLHDGARLAGIADDGGEPRLVVFRADGAAEPRVYDLDIGNVVELKTSPAGDLVALANHRNELLLADLAAGTLRVLDRSATRRIAGIAWSPDGQWLAYGFGLNERQTAIKVCQIADGATHQVTDPVLHDTSPAFDPAGRYLYFLGTRDFDPVQDNLHFEMGFPRGMRPYLITLRQDLRSPFMPEPSPLEPAPKSDEKSGEDKEHGKDGKAEENGAPKPVEIQLEGITLRAVAFPVAEGLYGRVQGTPKGAVYTTYPIEGTRYQSWASIAPEAKASLEFYDFDKRKQEHLADAITDFAITPDGKTLIYRSGERLRVIKAGEKPQDEDASPGERDKAGRGTGWLDLDRVKVSIHPDAEWRQMLGETWRLQREQFWVADMGGVDWNGVFARYSPLVDRISSRGELSDLIWEMQGELGSSHAYEMGGDYRARPQYRQGTLGVDWRLDAASGTYRIGRILRGDPWDTSATSPLLAPGVDVAVGDAVVAIDGQRVTAERGPRQLLVNKAGVEVAVTIQPAEGGDPRTVTVRALGDEHRDEADVRYRDWVEANRRHVHEATGGKVGYVHIPDMGSGGFAEFHRGYLVEYDHAGLIVDVRSNGGGSVSGLILEKLARRRLGYDFQRWGPPQAYIGESPRGPLVAITDENAGSDGDIFSHAFKMLNLGPLIGKRTWGGVIGINPYMPLADGTFTTQPEFSFWFSDVGWGVENYGTDPTIEVEYTPQDYVRGVDPQLERAISEATRLVAEHPSAPPTPGPHPHRGRPALG
ncbi:MAG TPA: PDZ domain-containing protein [Ktedonobacterales bacterium]|jgi:tricorn protease